MWMPTQLSQLIDPIARQAIGKDWPIFSGLLKNWREIVGQSYAANTVPVKLTFPHQPQKARRDGGTLTIRLPKGLAMRFTYDMPAVLERINRYFGYTAVSKIVLDPVHRLPTERTSRTEPNHNIKQQAATAVADIQDDALREALSSLGARIILEEGFTPSSAPKD